MEQTKQCYNSPEAIVAILNSQGMLCQSPGVNVYDNGSHSDGGEMGE